MKSKKNFLDYVPVLNDGITFTKKEDGNLHMTVENRGFYNSIAQKFFKKSRFSEIEIDEIGSFVLPLIDGKRTVYEIAGLLKEHFGEAAEPLYPRITQYMKILQSYNYIKLINN
ncbi:MAG: PqqD family protein [Lachnospiraceae bacterium]|nr:PqqD family protein [Lachnospiraceae bacterium]